VHGLPSIFGQLDAGLHDVALDPDFSDNGLVYFSWSAGDSLASSLEVSRARLEGNRLVDVTRIFRAEPARDTAYHYGGRLLLDGSYLYVTVGEHHYRPLAQDLSSDLGKTIRLFQDGRIPEDNPFVGRPGARPEIWTLGHRNPQGMARDPLTGEVWINEHGPLGGDELNHLRRGGNYGWPLVTWGREYDGTPVGGGNTHEEGVEQPVFVFDRSTAPSDMFFYTGDAFPRWKGSVFGGSMGRGRRMDRLVLEEDRVVFHERLLDDLRLRVRTIEQGPEGFIYVGVDEGILFRLRPIPAPGG
jgi:glucose/arabinose dehydrogenase